ncbi:polyisoprenoid-binding protein YceI [Luteimonas cucumeris]|uniref:Polyisoprenoid-binding protein YceI n=1 Tax=Luteimonas cucumeris TaxID=985012 RepID=A0A562L011_9GAMM|nr:YceI family protein [Luteimonas cucumeris]TWI00981.1 polyisoprenoid-binding protein YceI [Luteimonas cucumeris]
MRLSRLHALLALVLAASAASAEERIYVLDPGHTYPSFETDHVGMSTWRGKFNESRGEVQIDRERGTGQVDVAIDTRSIDFGNDALNEWAVGDQFLDTAKYPEATYRGKLIAFRDGAPTRVEGEFTLRGVTRPLTLTIDRFKCMPHMIHKRDWCGADAHATFDRSQFGLDVGKEMGVDMNVTLRIQVEADIKTDKKKS